MGGSFQGLPQIQNKKFQTGLRTQAANLQAQIAAATAEGKAIVAMAKTYADPAADKFKWNLPPHNWSLPLRPVILDYDYLRTHDLGTTPVVSDPLVNKKHVVGGSNKSSSHGLRRARMWFFSPLEGASVINPDTGESTTNAQMTADALIAQAKQGNYTPHTASVLDRLYGFQFLWNPTDINISVNRNADITPSAADRSGQLTGNFQGQEQLTFSILIDRTNDFACAKGLMDASGNVNVTSLKKYYTAFYPNESVENNSVDARLKQLLNLGTMADIEFLFKTINGNGAITQDALIKSITKGKVTEVRPGWYNGLGKSTADTGYLTSSLIAIQFGPDLQNNLSYTGWVESISISHSKFTENMIPLTSQVNVTMTCFSSHPF
jgi:hypothetical protein